MKHYKYLILGNGIAGYGALEALQEVKEDVAVISNEDQCFLRPLLSKTTFTSYNINCTYLPVIEGVTYIKDTVTSIDTVNHVVNGKYQYDYLIYALGAENRRLKGIDHAYYMRHVEDFYKIKRELPFVKHIAIVGAGMIGLEVAHLLRLMDKSVDIYEYADQLLPAYFSKADSDVLLDALHHMGIHVHLAARKQQYDEDMVIVAIGNEKNNLFGEPIKVNDELYFRDDIYACGDCVEGNYALWHEAHRQGQIAGQNVLGKGVKYEVEMAPVLCHLGEIGVYASNIASSETTMRVYHEDLFGIGNVAKATYVSIHDGHLIVIGDLRYVEKMKLEEQGK